MESGSQPQTIQAIQGEIEKLIVDLIKDGIKCPKNFTCNKNKFEELCKAGFVGKLRILCCLEENPQKCIFALFNNETYYCQCSIRKYIAERIGK
jgi:hypothetical protein